MAVQTGPPGRILAGDRVDRAARGWWPRSSKLSVAEIDVIITIDGPAGSGKSTTARKLAARLGIPYLDTGAMYRVVTLAARDSGVNLTDEQALTALAEAGNYTLDLGPTYLRVTLDGVDVTEELRSMWVNENVRHIAASPGVRKVLIRDQRALAARLGSLVTEGRDQGSEVFPAADMKFFLDADLAKRAERRYHELVAEGEDVTLEVVRRNLEGRDQSDTQRSVAPLKKPEGAIEIDTSACSLAEVLEQILSHLRRAALIPHAERPHHSV